MSQDTITITPGPDQLEAIEKFRGLEACLVGDEMGTGKTVTAIGRDFHLRKDYSGLASQSATLIICEKIGLSVWDYHLRAMGVDPDEIVVVDPTNRLEFEEELSKLDGGDDWPLYYVVHWDVIYRISLLTAKRGKKGTGSPVLEFFHVIADEAHLAKSPKALRTKCLKKIKTQKKTALTGTPADNKPEDFWSLLHWLYPRKFSSYWRFFEEYVEYDEEFVQRYNPKTKKKELVGYRVPQGPKNLEEFHRRISPFYIRRTLLEINPDIPPKIHVRPALRVELTPAMRRAYRQMEKKKLALIGPDADYTLLAPAQIAVVMRLQQMALASLDAEYEDWEFADHESDLPRIVLCKPSPKLDIVMNMLETNEMEPFIVFTWFRGMADLVEEECHVKGIPVSKITGAVTSIHDRAKAVEDFQEGRTRVFVGTIAAAGKTITLTAARHVIFTDRSWNPSKNAQAENRAWRRTTRNAVRIYDIEALDTIDEERNQRIEEKGEWVRWMVTPTPQS